MEKFKRFGVVGNPIKHSLSPVIHEAFAKQLKIQLHYERILAPVDDFSKVVTEFFHQGGSGLNITLPFKEKACSLVKTLTHRAARAAAVNTIYLDDNGKLCGDNTDGVGLRRDLEKNLSLSLFGKKMLLLGAGGAARGIAWELLNANPGSLTIANRTPSRALDLANEVNSLAVKNQVTLIGGGLNLAIKETYDIVINASSRGFSGDEPTDFKIVKGGWVYDLSYGPHSRLFLNFSEQKGANAVDGLGMLVEQAAEAFFCWHGIYPATSSLLPLIRSGQLQGG